MFAGALVVQFYGTIAVIGAIGALAFVLGFRAQ